MSENVNIEIEMLRTFASLVELRSFTLVASVTGRSQSAVSQQLKRLEEMLGQQLLRRSARGVKLTEQGRILHEYAVETINRNDRIFRDFRSALGLGPSLRLGLDEHVLSREVGVLAHFGKASLAAGSMSVTQASTEELLRAFSGGQLDVVIGVATGSVAGAVDLCRVPLSWVASPRFRIAPHAVIPLVAPMGSHPLRNAAVKALDQAKQPWELRYVANSATALQAGIVGGHGIGLLPSAMLDERLVAPPDLTHLPSPGALHAFALMQRGAGFEGLVEEVRSHLLDLFMVEA
ncbi:LysR family transcriptional regulator [Pelomonas sp. Root1217]|uniref:LysR family transcriptional regulator n=1 Tax=Pelomonas sp. Root1217 TaxID=1736430 RepID=UPI0007096D07|nr:LysR family transcriptional regulator [Pelomonas sp. Root1217]